jgi:hypothetical protein
MEEATLRSTSLTLRHEILTVRLYSLWSNLLLLLEYVIVLCMCGCIPDRFNKYPVPIIDIRRKGRMSGEMGGSALEMALIFWFIIITLCFLFGLSKLLQWIYNKRKA